VLRRTMRQRWQAKLQAVKAELWQRLHHSIPEQGAYLRSVIAGHVRCYGVPDNQASLGVFRRAIAGLWWRTLIRRSQRSRLTWHRMQHHIQRWLPPAHVCRLHPIMRFGVMT
jgi:hypothetical protein